MSDCASTRYSARTSRTSWPRFISGTSTFGVLREHVAEVLRERVEVHHLGVVDPPTAGTHAAHRLGDRAPGAAPPEHEHLGRVGGAVSSTVELRDVVGDAVDLVGAQMRHELVVGGRRS